MTLQPHNMQTIHPNDGIANAERLAHHPPAAFKLYQSLSNGYGLKQASTDSFFIHNATWALDNQGVFLSTAQSSKEANPDASTWVSADGKAIVRFPVPNCRILRWAPPQSR